MNGDQNTTHEPRLVQVRSKSPRRNVTHVQGACSCGWKARTLHPTRTIEGRALGERDANRHAQAHH
jgi:hypothetical protein